MTNDMYIVIETIDGKRQPSLLLDESQLDQHINYLSSMYNNNRYQMVTQKKGWYRINYGNNKSFIRYKKEQKRE
jgi:5-methylcytosine-specific restriction endonuclease McrA